jgi:hypothetical protein
MLRGLKEFSCLSEILRMGCLHTGVSSCWRALAVPTKIGEGEALVASQLRCGETLRRFGGKKRLCNMCEINCRTLFR